MIGRKAKLAVADFASDLDTPLLKLSGKDVFTIRDATQGVHIWGGIGSGKTSGSGKALAAAYLRAGMGGVVCVAKPEDVDQWLAYAKANGRSSDVLVFDDAQGHNWIDYELSRHGPQGISNVTEAVIEVTEAADSAVGNKGNSSDPFWGQSKRQMLGYTIPALYSAHGAVTVADVMKFVLSAAVKAEQYVDDTWAANSFAAQTLRRMSKNPFVRIEEHLQQAILDFWFNAYPRSPEKTRASVIVSLSAALDRFKSGRLRKNFCDRTTIVPEMAFHGAIIILAMPVLTHRTDGLLGQLTFKSSFQKAVEARNSLEQRHRLRPVFVWADESQHMVTPRDDEFLSICRGSRCCMVYLTQTLPSYVAKMGKEKSDSADGLVGKFANQIFHLNNCNRTNEYASKMIGRGMHWRKSRGQSKGSSFSDGMNTGSNTGESNHGGGWFGTRNTSDGQTWGTNRGRGSTEGTNTGESEHMDHIFEPNFFGSQLKSGGPKHGNIVTGLWVKVGLNGSGTSYLLCSFKQ